MKKSIGYNIEYSPEKTCEDVNCPYHGKVSLRGKSFVGTITSDKMKGTVRVEWENMIKDPKYSRYFKKTSSVLAHNPECISAKEGDKVEIYETRPLSKRKHFVVVRVLE